MMIPSTTSIDEQEETIDEHEETIDDDYSSFISDYSILRRAQFLELGKTLPLYLEQYYPLDDSKAQDNLKVLLHDNNFELIEEIDPYSVLVMILNRQSISLANLKAQTLNNTNLTMSLYLYQDSFLFSSNIILMCREKSTLKLFKVKPIYSESWECTLMRIYFNHLLDKNGEDQDESDDDDDDGFSFKENHHVLKNRFSLQPFVPSLFRILGITNSEYSIRCDPHPSAKLLFVCLAHSHSLLYSSGVFIKLTHLNDPRDVYIMKYLQALPQTIKDECNHIAQVYDFQQIYVSDDLGHDVFLACYGLVKNFYGNEVCESLDIDNFDSAYSRAFFTFKRPIQITYLEMLQPLNIKEMVKNMKELMNISSRLKILILIRWIGQCLTILQQLHNKLNILHCDISFDNILTRKSTITDEIGQLILNEHPDADRFVTDLVLSDLNTAQHLTQPQNNSSDELRKTINPPNTIKFPYTFHTYEYYGFIQSDHYAMAIFIAKLVKRFLFEDFTDFLNCKIQIGSIFKDYGNRVIKYFEDKLSDDENCNEITKIFLTELIELLKYIIYQNSSQPSLLSKCFEIYQNLLNQIINFPNKE